MKTPHMVLFRNRTSDEALSIQLFSEPLPTVDTSKYRTECLARLPENMKVTHVIAENTAKQMRVPYIR